MKRLVLQILLAAAVFSAGPTFAQAAGAAGVGAPTLNPGDMVRITVFRKPELSGEFEIAADGTIRHPLYREVQVTGIPVVEAEGRLREFLRRYETSPQFVVEPRLRVGVGGEVRQPGLLTLAPEVTLAQAVALAGGPTERGYLEQVRVFRGGQELSLDLTRPNEGLASTPVRSGDQLVVQRRRSVFRDVVAPAASITAALGTILNIILR